MNKRIVFISVIIIFVYSHITDCQALNGVSPDAVDVHKWAKEHFARGKVPPFSFVYGGKSSDSFIKNWTYSAEKKKQQIPLQKSMFTPIRKRKAVWL